jgi:UDP-N-acetylmuramoylalanine--D-glutamate ligase
VADVLRSFQPLAHRVQEVGTRDGVTFFDDSKATVPHATVAAVESFDSVVLICGGRNKGLDLSALAPLAPRLRAVIAIGEAADEVASVFEPTTPVHAAGSMAEAVAVAAAAAIPGDAVLLSPACASFDWYRSYAERGDAFQREVRRLIAGEDG